MFKATWEKTSVTHQFPNGMVEKMVCLAYPDQKLISRELIAGGCANLNYKIQLEHENQPLILRVYLRDKDAAYREKKLANLLKETVPVPLTHYIGELEGHHFAITEFMPGISLRDLLLGNASHDRSAIMHEVGTILSKITVHEFLEAGFFDKELNLISHSPSDDYLIFAKDCLQNKTVQSVLTPQTISKINQVLGQYGHLFPDESEKHLVHADFDPANILVHKIDGFWKVSGILDWEFAFSGSVLCDVANMLRYAHKMPPEFQNAFLKGLGGGGVTLPKNWHITIQLLNLLSLLDCLKRSDPKNSPNQCSGIRELIDHILSELNNKQTSIQTGIERIGNEIHRPSGPWTKQVHMFLNFLHNNGFMQAPQALGFDEEGREILSFVKGQTSEDIKSLESLISSAKLLRSYHDASQKFLNELDLSQSWMFDCRDPQEVICHNDFAPYNICFDGEQAIGVIDFDTAHPGPRVWDIAYALYRFAPFTNPDNEDGFGGLEEQISRAKVFCDAYGLESHKRIGLADLIIERLQNLLDFLLQSASQGHKKYELNLKDGHHLKYRSDLEYIKFHKSTIQDGLKSTGEK